MSIIQEQSAKISLAQSSMSSASSLVGLQLFSRLFTFAMNQAMLRMASPQAYGVVAIQFELMLSTILFLSREGVRTALLRAWPGVSSHTTDRSAKTSQPPTSSQLSRSAAITNLAFLPLLFGIPLAVGATLSYANLAAYAAKSLPRFTEAISLYAIAAVLELASEPFHNRAMGEGRTAVRVRAEGFGVLVKSAITCLVLILDSRREVLGDLNLLAFASGQLAYALSMLTVYVSHFEQSTWHPERLVSSPTMSADGVIYQYFDSQLLRLSLSMTAQSFFKHLLTEGDKFILSWASPLKDQGGYAIAVNYGSLIARIVLQPVEETLRVYFSKIVAQSRNAPSAARASKDPSAFSLQHAGTTVISLLSVQISLATILVTFGSLYMPIALAILLPPRYLLTSAPSVLAAWVWYIPILAVNGALEAFVSSVAQPEDLKSQSRWMAIFSIAYVSAAAGLYKIGFGDTSLVYANIINLSGRILYCMYFMTSWFDAHQAASDLVWKDALPMPQLVALSGASAAMILYIDHSRGISQNIQAEGRKVLLSIPVATHVALGGALALSCLTVWWMTSGRLLASSRRSKIE